MTKAEIEEAKKAAFAAKPHIEVDRSKLRRKKDYRDDIDSIIKPGEEDNLDFSDDELSQVLKVSNHFPLSFFFNISTWPAILWQQIWFMHQILSPSQHFLYSMFSQIHAIKLYQSARLKMTRYIEVALCHKIVGQVVTFLS